MHVCLCDDGLIGCHAFISQLQTRGPIFSDSRWDSFIGSVGHSEPVGFFHQYEEDVLKVSRGPCDGAAIRPFGHHPDAFSVFRPQWFYLIGGVVLLIASLLISLLLVRQMVWLTSCCPRVLAFSSQYLSGTVLQSYVHEELLQW